jgi:hypothetical protein
VVVTAVEIAVVSELFAAFLLLDEADVGSFEHPRGEC